MLEHSLVGLEDLLIMGMGEVPVRWERTGQSGHHAATEMTGHRLEKSFGLRRDPEFCLDVLILDGPENSQRM